MAYAFVGLTALAAIFAFVALDAVDESTQSILRERLSLAQTVAHSIDQTIVTSQSLLQRTSGNLATAHAESGVLTDREITMLESLGESLSYVNSGISPESVFLFNDSGEVVWNSGTTLTEIPPIPDRELFDDPSRPSVTSIGQKDFAISIGADVAHEDLFYLGAIIVPSQGLLEASSQSTSGLGEYRMELVDSMGRIVTQSSADKSGESTLHMSAIGDLVVDRVDGVGRHTSNGDAPDGSEHIVAYAPLESVPWGVVLEQREDTALAVPNSLRRRVIWIATIGLLAGLTMAWITSRQVVRPLARLTGRADAITAGDLSSSIDVEGQDEVRRLARSFETMRSRLDASQRELSEWSLELENRVRERTDQLVQRDQERDLLLGKVISAQEEERRRIARDLHDQIGQSLTGLVMQIGGLESSLADDQRTLKSQLAELGESAGVAVEEVRRMMSDLRPSILDDMGLESAVSWLAERSLEREGIAIDLDINLVKAELSPELETSVFRVFQEAVNNVTKHAQASRVEIALSNDNEVLLGSIVDDGVGFDSSEIEPGHDGGWAVGLLGMSERISLLGGALEIESSPGDGTRIRFTIPTGGDK